MSPTRPTPPIPHSYLRGWIAPYQLPIAPFGLVDGRPFLRALAVGAPTHPFAATGVHLPWFTRLFCSNLLIPVGPPSGFMPGLFAIWVLYLYMVHHSSSY